VDYSAVCGNISSAVGPYAIEEGLVRAAEPHTRVRIHSTNIGRIIEATVPVEGNVVKVLGDYAIDGVPGTGAKIELNWADTAGANTGSVLPTGNARDRLDVGGLGTITCSIVDVGNPGVFVKAEDLGLKGTEGPDEIDGNPDLLDKCEAIARSAQDKIGVPTYLTLVSPPRDYTNHVTGTRVHGRDVDYLVRMIFMNRLHKAYAASQITCSGAAAEIPGTVVNEVRSGSPSSSGKIVMGHPAGLAEVEVEMQQEGGSFFFRKIAVHRTARRLLEGYVFVKSTVFEGLGV
jgi:2-methylaconitate cis-trans-isomerase PrpF